MFSATTLGRAGKGTVDGLLPLCPSPCSPGTTCSPVIQEQLFAQAGHKKTAQDLGWQY